MPSYNEELAICQTIDDIRRCIGDATVIVVDGNSSDTTRDLAVGKGCLVTNTIDRGKGRQIRKALASIRSPYFIMMDSDYTYPAEYIPQIMTKLANGADVVMGYRDAVFSSAMTKTNRFGNSMLSMMASILYGSKVRDVCTGMWGFKQDAIDKFNLISEGFTLEADLFVNAVKNGCRIEQIPIHYRPRPDGSRPKLKVKDGFKIGWFLIKKRFG